MSPILRQYLTTEQFKSVVHYLEAAGYSHDYPAFFDEFNRTTHQPGDKIIMQTLSSYLRQEGMQQGIDQTNRKHIFKMKAKRYTNREIAEIMELSEADVVHCLEAVAH